MYRTYSNLEKNDDQSNKESNLKYGHGYIQKVQKDEIKMVENFFNVHHHKPSDKYKVKLL